MRGRNHMPASCPRCGLGVFLRAGEEVAAPPDGRDQPVRKDPTESALPSEVRWPIELAVTCRPQDQDIPGVKGRTGNISRSGLLLWLPREFAPGTRLELTLNTENGPVLVDSTVVWIDSPVSRKPGEDIRHGARITSSTWKFIQSIGLLRSERTLR